jgi:hypothetical protein
MIKVLHKLAMVTLFMSSTFYYAKGQTEVKANDFFGKEIISEELQNENLKLKANYSNWKFPVDAITQLTSLDRFVNFIFQDTAVKFVYSDGQARHNTWNSVGAAFTPNDPNLELSDDNIILSRYNEYSVDSIYFPYLYVRYIDEIDVNGTMTDVVDTLIVQFFKFDNLRRGQFVPTGEDPNLFMIPNNWTPSLHGSNSPAYQVRIPLTIEDTTSQPSAEGWGTRGQVIPVPTGVGQVGSDAATTNLEFKNVFGFSISFATMVPYQFGDTMEARDGSEITNKMNYFGHSMYINNSVMVPQTEYCNNSWWVPGEIGYGGDQNGWENAIPGNAYFQDRYVNYAIHVTTDKLGTEELDNNLTFGVYPNPVHKNEFLKADFNLINASNVTIELFDLLGNKVKEIANGYYTSGEHTSDVNISDLDAGMYVYTIKAGNAVSSKKVTIID